ncbi:MAG: CheR family methyltransferase [Alphaproteobacteria bacterium]|jgi:chemotaxis protein methyltransferase CheR
MKPEHYKFLIALLQRECGLVLDAEKAYLAESRLAPVARQFGHADIDQLVANVMSVRSKDGVRAVVEAMVTHETFFFRDRKPFDHFRDFALPALLDARATARRLSVWSAAASTGQEAYSLAMLLDDRKADLKGWRTTIVGTDISEQALERAKSANYSQFEVQRGLPIKRLVAFFNQKGDRWVIKPELRQMARFEKFNLLDNPTALGKFDVVFCRNVLIYFDVSVRRKILAGIAQQLNPGGYLYLGGAETTVGLSTDFAPQRDGRGVFQLVEKAARTPAAAAGNRSVA